MNFTLLLRWTNDTNPFIQKKKKNFKLETIERGRLKKYYRYVDPLTEIKMISDNTLEKQNNVGTAQQYNFVCYSIQ